MLSPAQEKDKSHFIDKDTGIDMELVDSMPLLEWLANNYKTFGATLEIVTDKSQEGSQFVRGFGGIGGKPIFKILCLGLLNLFFLFRLAQIQS